MNKSDAAAPSVREGTEKRPSEGTRRSRYPDPRSAIVRDAHVNTHTHLKALTENRGVSQGL